DTEGADDEALEVLTVAPELEVGVHTVRRVDGKVEAIGAQPGHDRLEEWREDGSEDRVSVHPRELTCERRCLHIGEWNLALAHDLDAEKLRRLSVIIRELGEVGRPLRGEYVCGRGVVACCV